MKKRLIYFLFTLVAAVSVSITGEAKEREVFNINRGWRFFSNSETGNDAPLLINLPHIWNYDALGGKRNYFRGIGNYLKEITIPSGWSGRRVFIKCYGANSISNLFVNGKHVGEHRGGYTAFAYDITDHLQFGKSNNFWIMVNNSPQTDVLPIAGDQNSYGGLFRDVELIVTGRDIVSLTDWGSDGVFVIQKNVGKERVDAEAVLKLNGVRDNNVTVAVTVTDANKVVAAEGTVRVKLNGRMTSEARIPFGIDNPRLWNGTDDPHLYNIHISVRGSGGLSDTLTLATGFRHVSVTPEGQFMLNGNPYKIKGVIATQDRAMAGTALTKYQVEEDFELITGMGANAVRIKGVCHHPEFYKLCDKHGILVWNDFPLMGASYLTDKAFIDTERFRDNGVKQAEEIIRQKFNHPSIVMWGIFSNLNLRGDNPVDYISFLNMGTKREDPSRLTVASSNEDGEINFITDLVCWDHHFGWREGMPSDIQIWKRQLQLNWNNIKSAVSYSAGASIYHQDDSLYRPSFAGNWHPERWQTRLHEEYYRYLKDDDFLWGIFIGNMFDYGAAGRVWGEGNGINDLGLVTFDRRYCKDAYYFYKANWNREEPFVYIAERRWRTRRRKRQNIKAYTNLPGAELFVNGVSQGTGKPENGTVIWTGVALEEGRNTVEVKSGTLSDAVSIDIQDRADRHRIM